MNFDIFAEIVFVEKMETLSCFSNERVCRALSIHEILVIVPYIKTMMSSAPKVADIDALIALFNKNDGSENDYLEKLMMAYICANRKQDHMRLEKNLARLGVKKDMGQTMSYFDPIRVSFSSFPKHISKIKQKGDRDMIKTFRLKLNIPDYDNLRETKKDKKYVCTCEVCEKTFQCSLPDAQVCRKCAKKYFLR